MDLTETQAHYVLGKMLDDKTVSRRDVDRYLREMSSDIEDLEERLARLRRAAGRTSGTSAATKKTRKRRAKRGGRKKASSGSDAAATKPRKGRKKAGKAKKGAKKAKRNLSPEVRASRALQGRYISNLRRFKGKKKAQFQKVAKEQGREEALRQMQAEKA